MSKVSNKEIEKYYFELFRKIYSLPSGEIEYGDKPDVIIDGPQKIGIEITNFYLLDGCLNKSEQNQQPLRENVVKNAQKLYLKNGGKDIAVSFDFDDTKPIKNRRNLEKKIAEYVKSVEIKEEGMMAPETFKEIPELSFVYLQRAKFLKGTWQIVRLTRGKTMSRNRLLENVATKERLVDQYRRCDSYWLLLIVDFMDPAQDQEIMIRGFKKIESGKFEKVLVFRTAHEHVLEAK